MKPRFDSGAAVRGGETVHALPAGTTKPGTKTLCGVLADPAGEPFDVSTPYACKNCLRKLLAAARRP